MAQDTLAPQNTEERVVYIALTWTWGWYLLGALYVVAPVVEVILLWLYAWRLYAVWRPAQWRPLPVPMGVWVWIAGMSGMLAALLIAHCNWGLGAGQTVKSSIGWLKGWAMLAAFPLAGACLRIRPRLVIRAVMWVAVQTLVLIPLLIAAALMHLPPELYTSPLKVIGGPGPEFFSVYLYIVDPENGLARWQFMAPWAPGAGFMGDMIFVLAQAERHRGLRLAASLAAVLICLMTASRMAVLFLFFYPPFIWFCARLSQPFLLGALAALSVFTGMVADNVYQFIQAGISTFKGARASSSRVREALGQLAYRRWQEEAPIFGHGVVQRGTHYVEFMPIGSHHTWYGLLYVKGLAGVVCLVVPCLWTMFEMLLLAQVSQFGRIGLAVIFMLLYYSNGENLEILAYLFWPALLLLGMAHAEAARRGVAALPAPAGSIAA
jgi:hypothetical protein